MLNSTHLALHNITLSTLHLYLHLLLQFSELEGLGYNGFAVAICGSKSQILGTPSVLSSLSPKIIEYFYSIITYGK